jgi:heme/copper-type cytochrome/quinol oxidase subunit 4
VIEAEVDLKHMNTRKSECVNGDAFIAVAAVVVIIAAAIILVPYLYQACV